MEGSKYKSRGTRVAVVIVAFVFLLAAFGGGYIVGHRRGADAEAVRESKEAGDDDGTVVTPQPSESDLMTTVSANADLSTFAAAITSADLAQTLHSQGPFTVFAPSNTAFDKLPPGTLDTLLKSENKAQLTSTLSYHMVPGALRAKDLTDGQTLKTVEGGQLTVSATPDKKILMDEKKTSATVTTTDIESSNGVLHIIDTVLQPQMPTVVP